MDTICKIWLVTVIAILYIQKSSCQLNWNGEFLGPQQQDTDINQLNNNQGTNNVQQQSSPAVDPTVSSTSTTASPLFRSCFDGCQTVQNYNPVCGSDGVTYNNEFRLQCARRCGQQVQLVRGGSCNAL